MIKSINNISDKKNITFKGLNFEIAHLIRNKSFTEGADLFINSEKKELVNTAGDIHAIGNAIIKKIVARIAELFDTSQAKTIKAKYATITDSASAKNITTEISASIYTNKMIKKVKSFGNIEIQPNKKGVVEVADAKDELLIGQKGYVKLGKAKQIELINKGILDRGEARKLFIADENSKTTVAISQDDARIRGKAKVGDFTGKNHLGLSEECKLGKIIMTGNNPEIHIMGKPTFKSIEFLKGKGKIILHPTGNKYPRLNKNKIIGDFTIEKSQQHAASTNRPSYLNTNEELFEYYKHF